MEHLILPSAQPLRLPFSQAVRAGDFLFLSGAIGAKPGTLTLVEGGLIAQARQAMENIGEVLRASGLGYVIFYRVEGEDVFILHVLDGRRDIPALV
jgi:2-iminobutanoate/2-iminopropanoate deaminase